MKVARIIVGILFLAALSACGVVNLVYNNAPTAVAYVVDDWFDLTRAQRAWLKPRVESLVEWHRASELPTYQKLLSDAREQVMRPVAIEHIDLFYGQSRLAAERLAEKAMPDLVGFLQLLEPKQIAFLERKLAADNDKLAKELKLGLEERRRKRVERYVDRFEGWFGRLSPEQMAVLKTRVEEMPFSEELRLADRRRWQTGLVGMLKNKADSAVLANELRVLLLSPEQRRAADYRAKWEMQQQLVTQLTAELLQIASPKQKQAVQRKLAGYAQDVSSLLKS
ncbi:MAG: DUF6279 family lipoprotein [Burkholderiales bacterium]